MKQLSEILNESNTPTLASYIRDFAIELNSLVNQSKPQYRDDVNAAKLIMQDESTSPDDKLDQLFEIWYRVRDDRRHPLTKELPRMLRTLDVNEFEKDFQKRLNK